MFLGIFRRLFNHSAPSSNNDWLLSENEDLNRTIAGFEALVLAQAAEIAHLRALLGEAA